MNFRPVKAADAGHLVLVSGEEYGDQKVAPFEWGLVVGNPRDGAQVLTGSRDDIVAWLDRAREELVSYAVAEHENGYHLGQPEARCPECARGAVGDADEPGACPACGSTDTAWQGPETTRAACDTCAHGWWEDQVQR